MTETQRAALAGKRGRTSSEAASVHSDEEETRTCGARAPATQLVLSPNRFDALAGLADSEAVDSRIAVAPPSPAADVMAPPLPAAAMQVLTSPAAAMMVLPAPAPATAAAPAPTYE